MDREPELLIETGPAPERGWNPLDDIARKAYEQKEAAVDAEFFGDLPDACIHRDRYRLSDYGLIRVICLGCGRVMAVHA